MTNDEARSLIRDAFIAFPSVLEWLKEKSPDAEQTIAGWSNVVSKMDSHYARKVLDAWRDGTIQPPKAYERDQFVLIWRQTALHLIGEATRSNALDEQRKTLAAGKTVTPFSLATDDLYNNEWLPMKAMVESGEITKEEAIGRWKRRLNEVFP